MCFRRPAMCDFIIEEFYQEMKDVDLNVYGILDAGNYIHTLGTDSKIIGRVFEMLTQPVLKRIAERHNMILATPESQTVYPDFILMTDPASDKKIAIDVKTTYVENDNSRIVFTLGSFASYMRNNTKNIEYKYTDYIKHYVVGFVYKRNGEAQESDMVPYSERETIQTPYLDVKYFIQEKYKIAGDKPGSGNTENLGSFATKNFDDLKEGNGPFSQLGVDVFDIYWKYYPQYRSQEKNYTSLPEFLVWFNSQNEDSIQLFHEYNFKEVCISIEQYKRNSIKT